MPFIYFVLASLDIIFHVSPQQSSLPRLAALNQSLVVGLGVGVRPKISTNWKLGREMDFQAASWDFRAG